MSDYEVLKAEDAPNYTEGSDEAFYGYAALGSDQVSVNVVVLEPDAFHKAPGMAEGTGHSHEDIDEIYVVVGGEVTVRADDDEFVLGPLDSIRFAPHVKRATRNLGDVQATVLMVSPKMSDPRAQSHFHEGFWS